MIKKLYILTFLSTLLTAGNAFSQAFANGELDGPTGVPATPPSWQVVPDTDPNCLAGAPIQASCDVIDALGPNMAGGIVGAPFSGTAAVSGLQCTDNGANYWHEGIQQTVNGFTVGDSYTICFYQAVVKQLNCVDPTGSWSVYFDNTFIATTATTTSLLAPTDPNLNWELRSVTFTATAASHVIKFLPADDDPVGTNNAGVPDGGLRMGIDLISFGPPPLDPTITPGVGPLCTSNASVILTAVDGGGTWSGTGIVNGTTGEFDPATAGVGSHVITYTLMSGCAGTVTDNITIDVNTNFDASWTAPGTICEADGPIDLSLLITGTTGGVWAGTGVTGNSFDPTGLSGAIAITYSGGTAPCDDSNQQNITVVSNPDPTWVAPVGLCNTAAPQDLDLTVTGTAGGTWSGTGMTGNMFDPSVGTQTITYTVGSGTCQQMLALTITVGAGADASWTPPASVCELDGIIDLNTLITGTAGGTWAGTGVTGNNFDPIGLSGPIAITYSVGTTPCDDMSNQNITVVANPDPTWVAPTGLCNTSPLVDLTTTITGTTGGTWSGTGVTGNNFDPASGTQTVTYTVGTGTCQQMLALTITVGTGADPSWTTLTMCISDAPINLTGQITGDPGGTWTGTGITGTVFDPFFGTQSITYTVGSGGCTSNSTQTITVVDPQLNATGVSVSCFGLMDGSASVTATGVSGTETYSWNSAPPQNTANATGLPAGTYTVTVTDGSCTATADVTIIEPAEIAGTLTGTNGCDPTLGAAVVTASGGVGGYQYAWNNSTSTSATATDLDSNMHTVTVTDGNGCTYQDSVLVQLFPSPTITTINDTTIIYGECISLPATGGISYTWTPDTELDCDNCQAPSACPLELTTYCVEGTDINGCKATDCVIIDVEIICGDVFVPSAFSPNNDGENDLLCVYSDCMQNMSFRIYNRWGEKVYESNNANICWDGTWKGKELNSAVFVYVLEGTLINNQAVNQKGNISLIR